MPNSSGEDSRVSSYSSRSSQGLGHPTVPPGLVLPSPQARMDKGAAGDHEDGGWPGLASSLPPGPPQLASVQSGERISAALSSRYH